MRTHTAEIPLSRIKEDPFLTPEVLDIKKHLSFDRERVEKYFTIVSELNFKEYIKVWNYNGTYVLIENYEYLCALRKFYEKSPDESVVCLVVEAASHDEIKKLSLRLRNLNPTDSHTERCLNIFTLVQMGCSLQEIKILYSVKKSHSAEGKKFQRDYRIVRHREIFNRVMGLPDQWDSPSIVSELKTPKPPIYKATLSYAIADKILSILPDDPSYVTSFIAEYDKYLKELRERHLYEEEQTKPIYTWRNFNKDRVFKIARAVARGNDLARVSNFSVFGEKSREDFSWAVTYNENSHELKIPQVTVNLANKGESNLKKIIELKYKMESLNYSLTSYIKRIAPAEHGATIRVKDASIEPPIETMGNMSRFADTHYFEYIRAHKLLHYCNRDLLLRSIGLRAHHFGFERYEPNAESTYKKATDSFTKWYDEIFSRVVHIEFGGAWERHPTFSIYHKIRKYLAHKSEGADAIYFCDFIIEMFTFVFKEMDVEAEAKSKRAQNLLASDLSANIHSGDLDKSLSVLVKAGIAKEKAAALLREIFESTLKIAEQEAAQAFKNEKDHLATEIQKLRQMIAAKSETIDVPSINKYSPLYPKPLADIAQEQPLKKKRKRG